MHEIENSVNLSPSKYRNVMSPIKRRGHVGKGQLKRDDTRAETRFRLSAKRKNGRDHFNWRGCQFSRLLVAEVCASAFIVGSNAGYTICSKTV